MKESTTDFIKTIKNNPEAREEQICSILSSMINIIDKEDPDIIHELGITYKSLLLSLIERVSYYDKNRTSYDTYIKFTKILNLKPIHISIYEQNVIKDNENANKSCLSIVNVHCNLAKKITNQMYRVYLILLIVSIFKEEDGITTKQKGLIDQINQTLSY